STTQGAYYVCALIDSGNAVAESDEGNNDQCTANAIQVSEGNSHGHDENGTLIFSIDSDEGYIFWHKIVVSEEGDAMALWNVGNAIQNVSSVWASYYNHTAGT